MDSNIVGSVGPDSDTRKGDTRRIQRLPNLIFPAHLLVVDGLCGAKTSRRIERFQRRFMRKPDGRIDPDGRTLKCMIAAALSASRDWSRDSSRWSQEKKLASLDRTLRSRVERLLETMKSDGFKPKIFFGCRSLAVQQERVNKGRSTVRFSFHDAQKKNGILRACAVDIIDKRWAWGKKGGDKWPLGYARKCCQSRTIVLAWKLATLQGSRSRSVIPEQQTRRNQKAEGRGFDAREKDGTLRLMPDSCFAPMFVGRCFGAKTIDRWS